MERTAGIPTGPTASSRLDAFPCLASLVGQDALAGFLALSLGKAPFRTRLDPHKAADLFGWERLNAILAEQRLAPPRLKLEMEGTSAGKGVFRERRNAQGHAVTDVDLPALQARLREGATLILDAVNEFGGPLQRLCDGLAAEFHAASQANLYACWGRSQGFNVHWDDHDVFVIQVAGTKRWSLYGVTRAAPLRRDAEPAPLPPDQPCETITLAPGDVLYLPRGYWHAAVGLGEPSLHLTVGLTRKTGRDFLAWLADRATADDLVRADLPLEADDQTLGRRLAELMARLDGGADPRELGRAYRRSAEARAFRPELSFPWIGEPAAYAPETRVRLSRGAARLCPGDAAGAVILRHRGVDYTLAAALAGPAEALARGEAVSVEALAHCADPQAVTDFVTDMLRRGVFVLVPP